MHIATVLSVWVGSTVGGVPVARLQLQIAGEDNPVQKTIGGHKADSLFAAYGIGDPRAMKDTRWIVEVKGVNLELVRPA